MKPNPRFLLACVLLASSITVFAAKRPNILLIVGEDHGAELSCYGDPVIQTPHIDSLADDGMLFENGYVTQSVCSPSRSTLFTGPYPHQNGQLGLATHNYAFFKKWPTSYSLLKQAGYRTGLIGKTHINPKETVEDHVDFRFQPSSNFSKRNVSAYAEESGRFIRDSDEPFFLTVNYPDAQWPLQDRVGGLPETLVDPAKVQVMPYVGHETPRLRGIAQNYYNCMLRLDACVGQPLGELKDSGKADNTLVVFIGDHGAQMARGKVTVYEGGMRVPFLARWPGVIKEGQRSDALVSTIDLLPTFLDAAKASNAPDNLPGQNLRPLFTGKAAADFREFVVCERNCDAAKHTLPQRTIRDSRFKLIHTLVQGRVDNAARVYQHNEVGHWHGSLNQSELPGAPSLVRAAYKRWLNPPEFQLYDLKNDPHEWSDLAGRPEHAETQARLLSALNDWRAETKDPLLSPEKLQLLMTENDAVAKAGRRSPKNGWQYLSYLAPESARPSAKAKRAKPGSPNILFIAIDDLRPELGCYGAKHIISPNIDKLAASGVRFDRAYCQQAICGPSRASLLLGMRPDSTQIHGNHKHFRDHYPDLPTLPQHFKDNGYHAQSMGKIYHGVFPKGSSRTEPDTFGDAPSWSAPTYRPGPRYYYTEEGIAAAKQIYQQIYTPKAPGPDDWTRKLVFGPMTEAPEVSDDVLYDGKVAGRAVETLQELAAKPDQPWFLAVGFIKPHTPFIAPRKYWDLYDPNEIPLADRQEFPEGAPTIAGHGSHEIRRYTDQPKKGAFTEANQRRLKHAYYACVSYIDAQIGRVLNELERQGLDGNTLVVLWSDHGFHLGEQGLWGKTTNYELDTRVALIVRAPGAKANGQSSRALVELVDLYPTLADYAGLPLPSHLEGTSLRPLLDQPDLPWKQAAFSQYSKGRLRGYAMRTDKRRYVEWMNPTTGDLAHTELYDYSSDLLEKKNLAGDQPELATQLSGRLKGGQGWRGAKPRQNQLTLGAPFSDHMVLQRNKPIRIWGAAAPDTTVTVRLAGEANKTQSGADGKWSTTFKPRGANAEPQGIEVRSDAESIQLNDILIGDVWLCAGQSNMRWMVRQSDKAREEIAKANHPDLRLIHFQDRLYPTGKKYSLAHLRGTTEETYYRTEGWRRCSPDTAAEFSAVAYFFGETLHRKTGVPIGLVHNAVGGVPMESYLPPSAFAADPELSPLLNDYLNNPLYPTWCRQRAALNLSAWRDAGSPPPTPGHPFAPGFLWNAGMKAWTQFPLQGFVWYQGESNATADSAHKLALDPAVNKRKFRALISSWRSAWGEPDLPFLFVQLPGLNRDWELFREMQGLVEEELANVGMAVTLDLGHPTNVHPTNKRPVGERLAQIALGGPMGARPKFESAAMNRSNLVIELTSDVKTRDGASVARGFTIATNVGGPFLKIDGVISADTVSLMNVGAVKSIRYAWSDDPSDANLIGTNGLPVEPMRFDKWKIAMAAPGKAPSKTPPGTALPPGPANTSFENVRPGPFTSLTTDGIIARAAAGHAEINSRFAHTGKQCLRLFGGTNASVEFDLPRLELPGEIRFQAERWTKRDPFKFRVEADLGDGAWKEIYNGDKKLKVGARFLSDVRIPLDGDIPKKLRFSCAAPKNSGCLIDSFRVTSRKKMELGSIVASPRRHPILLGKKENALTRIQINTSGSLEPLTLTGVRAAGSRPGLLSLPASAMRVWAGGAEPGQGTLFSANPTFSNGIEFLGKAQLADGANTFWISGEPRANAPIGATIPTQCLAVQINGKWRALQPESTPGIQRIGVALRQAGQDDVNTYRIPGLATTTKGTLIAVYDNRYKSRGDLPGDVDVGMSRSTDGGQSWEPMRVIMDMGADPKWNYDGIGDPAILVDDKRGSIWVAATWSHGNRSWNGSGPGLTPEETGQLMLARSDDDGLTWSKPINITRQVKDPKWRFVLQGPGAGITLKDGTLVFPAQFRSAPDGPHEGRPFSTLIYSKDGGSTWKIGTGVAVNTNEAQLVQLGDGSIMINCRDLRGGSRRVAVTRDLGRTWTEHPSSRSALPEPVCQASILRVEHEKHGALLFFANPPQARGRSNMTIKVSDDEGMTWPEKWHTLVDERSTAYSCLTRVDDDHIGLIYEGVRELYFVRYSIEELMGN